MRRAPLFIALAAALGVGLLGLWVRGGCTDLPHGPKVPTKDASLVPGSAPEDRARTVPLDAAHPCPLRTSSHLQITVLPRVRRLGDHGQPVPPRTPSGLMPTSRLVRLLVRRSREALESGWDLRICQLPVSSWQKQTVVEVALPRSGEFVLVGTLATHGTRGVLVTECRVRVVDDPDEAWIIRSLSARVLTPDGSPNSLIVRKLAALRDLRTVPALWEAIKARDNREYPARESAIYALGQMCHVSSIPRLTNLFRDKAVGVYAWAVLMQSLGSSFPPFDRPPLGSPSRTEETIDACLGWYHANEARLRAGLHQTHRGPLATASQERR